ncbi:1,4-alpha-glucan branching protein domain-containing protein, partial [candidate division KSB1 bacterium]
LDIYGDAFNRKGIEEFFMKYGIEYTFIDSHLLRGGKAIGVYADRFDDLKRLWKQFEKEYVFDEIKNLSPYSLYLINTACGEGKPVTIFTRDPKTGLQVWSGEHGYPGDSWYMEFHKKHFPGGLRYWRVTGSNCDLGEKMEYSTEIINSRINENSDHFAQLIKNTLKEYHNTTGQYGVLTAPYDTELFGHWWFEGPAFLEQLLEKLASDPEIKLSNAATECSELKPQVTVNIPEGSWGEGGYHYIWLNEDTQWTWKEIYHDEYRLKKILENYSHKDESTDSLIVQLAREFLLIQSSDWQFLISTRSARDYAELRFSEHHNDFNKLAEITENAIKGNVISESDKYFFNELKIKNSLFKEMKIEWLLESFKSHMEKKK